MGYYYVSFSKTALLLFYSLSYLEVIAQCYLLLWFFKLYLLLIPVRNLGDIKIGPSSSAAENNFSKKTVH